MRIGNGYANMQTCTPVECPKTYMKIGQGILLLLLSIHRGIKQTLKQSHTMDNNAITVEVLLLKDAPWMPPIICSCFQVLKKAPLERDAARFSLALAFKPQQQIWYGSGHPCIKCTKPNTRK